MWPELIKKSKNGGLNTIETYIFWNAHEPSRGQVYLYLSLTNLFTFYNSLIKYMYIYLSKKKSIYIICTYKFQFYYLKSQY